MFLPFVCQGGGWGDHFVLQDAPGYIDAIHHLITMSVCEFIEFKKLV